MDSSATTVTRTPDAPGGIVPARPPPPSRFETVEFEDARGDRPDCELAAADVGSRTQNLEGYKAGDQVTITYTRGVAVR